MIQLRVYGDKRFWIRLGSLDASILRETYIDRDYDPVVFCGQDRWLDIGAHIGAFSVLASPLVASVEAYEPETENFSMLRANLAVNGCRNVQPHELVLVGNDDVERRLWRHPDRNTAAHSLIEHDGFKPVAVACANINDVLHGIDCVKLDAEGAELELLPAIEDWSSIRQIVIEFHHLLIGDRYDELLGLLRSHFKLDEFEMNTLIQCNFVRGYR